jgi:hypothetical protein
MRQRKVGSRNKKRSTVISLFGLLAPLTRQLELMPTTSNEVLNSTSTTLQLTRHRSLNLRLINIKIRIHVLHVVMLFKRFHQPHHLCRL